MIFLNKTQRADWLCLLRTYCWCSQSSPVPPPQLLGEYFLETQLSLLGTLPWYLIFSSSFQLLWWVYTLEGHLWWLSVKESACNAGDKGWVPGLGRSPRGGPGSPPIFLPGKSHGLRSFVSYSPLGCKVKHDNWSEWALTRVYPGKCIKHSETTGNISLKYCDHPIMF